MDHAAQSGMGMNMWTANILSDLSQVLAVLSLVVALFINIDYIRSQAKINIVGNGLITLLIILVVLSIRKVKKLTQDL